ncbi:hypothetical protein PIB30_099737 [Stylosanthes scabra]|uniref:Uncharacterized protein n=1 Tax=Stylosanthes scabra TaxID=79078 RepID=A0ABU6YWB6_9FABA|nr:hypothetical protein [Stylosanthes scabra]
MLSYVWLPRKGNHGTLSEEDLIILWSMVEKIELNWPYLIAHHLMNYTMSQVELGLGHDMLWTKVFEHFGIDLSGENAIPIDDGNAITSKHLNRMRICTKATVEEDDVDEAVDEDVSRQSGASSATQFPPELMELFSQSVQPFHS